MKKSKACKKINNEIKNLNKKLQKDIFGDRFYLKQIQKGKYDGLDFFRYKFIDRIQPERNYETPWFVSFESWKLFIEMNDFIVNSNFWEFHREQNKKVDNN